MSMVTSFPTLRVVTSLIFLFAGNNVTVQATSPGAARTYTMGDAGGNDSFAYLAATQTISNKTLGSNLAAGGFKITGLGTPTASGDAVTKSYADGLIVGLDIHAACQAATAAALPANTYSSGPQTLTATGNGVLTVDGYTVLLGDRILVKNEATGSHNGIYTVTTLGTGGVPYVLTRATDYNSTALIDVTTFTFIQNGSVNGGQGYVSTTGSSAVLDTTALTFSQFSGGQVYTQGNGITIASNVITAVADEVTLHVAVGGIQIKSTYTGQSSITTLGTIATGTWQGTIIDLAHGGSNANLTASAGSVAYSTASALALNTAVGSAGIPLVSGTSGTGAPTFSALNLAGGSTIVTGNLPIGNGGTNAASAATALANLGGCPIQQNVKAKSANYSLTTSDQIINVTTGTGTIAITAPTASGANSGYIWSVNKVDSAGNGVTTGLVTITPASGNINGVASLTIYQQGDDISIYNDGTNYWTC